MIPKIQEQALAKELRKSGKSMRTIAKELNVSVGSVNKWVKGIILTKDQMIQINPTGHKNWIAASKRYIEMHRQKRQEHQKTGRNEALNDPLHLAGCMLYWAEGSKGRNSVSFSNTDPYMIKFFVRFLRSFFGIQNEEITLKINCYTNNGISLEEIETFWTHLLELPNSCLRKATVNSLPSSSKAKSKTRHIYGVCRIEVNRTDIVQRIFGAIQQYGGFSQEEWLD